MSQRPDREHRRGQLITLDGIDGTGKSTQIGMLGEFLSSSGLDVLCVRDPGSTPVGAKLREILLASELHMHRRTEAMLFMASRCEMVESILEPALAEGRIVISDRFLLANVVYQSVGGQASPELLWRLGRLANNDLEPDLTILLDMPVEVAVKRLDRPADRMEKRGMEYMRSVRAAFLEQLSNVGGDGVVVDASRPMDVVAAEIRQIVVTHLEKVNES